MEYGSIHTHKAKLNIRKSCAVVTFVIDPVVKVGRLSDIIHVKSFLSLEDWFRTTSLLATLPVSRDGQSRLGSPGAIPARVTWRLVAEADHIVCHPVCDHESDIVQASADDILQQGSDFQCRQQLRVSFGGRDCPQITVDDSLRIFGHTSRKSISFLCR